MNGCSSLQHVAFVAVEADAVANGKLTAILLVVESEVLAVQVAGIVIQAHAAEVVVLVESLHSVLDRDAVSYGYVVNGALATKLETVAVAVVGVVSQGYVTRLTIVVGDVDAIALELVEPLLVGLVASVLAHVVFLRTVAVADAVLDGCAAIVCGGVSVEVPAIIRVVPGTTATIGVSTTIILLVGKAVSVATEVGSFYTLELIVEIIVRVAVDDHLQ